MKGTYFGFTNNLKPMQAAKVEKSLDMLVRYDDEGKEKVCTKKEFVYARLQKGCKPELEENYSYYSPRIDDYTKPKTLYKLVFTDGNTYSEINKTLYNYALHLIENNFLDEEKATAFIEQEKNDKEVAEHLEKERIQKEEEERQRLKEEQEKKRREELAKKQQHWLLSGRALLERLKTNPITTTLDVNWNEMKKMLADYQDEPEAVYEGFINKFTMMLGNQALCSHRTQFYVENENDPEGTNYTLNGYPSLFLEKEILFKTFNIELTDKPATITAKVKAVFAGREYKGSKPIKPETFYYLDGARFIECEAEPIQINGFTFFILSNDNYHSLYESRSGRRALKDTSKSKLLTRVKKIIKENKIMLQNNIDNSIQQRGISPKFKNETLEVQFNEEGQGVLF